MDNRTRVELVNELVEKLNLTDVDDELHTLLEDEISDAEVEVQMMINDSVVPEDFHHYIIDLAALYYGFDTTVGGFFPDYEDKGEKFDEAEFHRKCKDILREVKKEWDW